LVDAEWWSSDSHTLRVAQSPTPLKGVPRYLTLSTHDDPQLVDTEQWR
jgi:hypothetical protein